MMTKSVFTTCLLGATLMAGLTGASHAQPAASTADQDWANNLNFEVRAIGQVGGVPVALIDVNGEPSVVKERSRLATSTVREISAGKGQVVLSGPGKVDLVLPLSNPRDISFPELTSDEVDDLVSPKQTADMAQSGFAMSDEMKQNWSSFPRERREGILLRSLKKGLVITYVKSPSGMTGSVDRLFGDLAMQRQNERRAAFEASLSPAQQKIYAQAKPPVFDMSELGKDPVGVQMKAIASKREIDAAMGELKKTLTPEQKKLCADAGL